MRINNGNSGPFPIAQSEPTANSAPIQSPTTTAPADRLTAKAGSLFVDTSPIGEDYVCDYKDDIKYDGLIIGAQGQTFTPDTDILTIPPLTPSDGEPASGTVIYLNGIVTDVRSQYHDMQELADCGLNVIGIHNATKGYLRDLCECLGDKIDYSFTKNNATKTTADVIYNAIKDHRPVSLAGHSQGALIISRAITDVKKRLMVEDGLSSKEATKALSVVSVETFGGAAMIYEDGPAYTHHINKLDVVPVLTGVGLRQLNPFSKPGQGAIVNVYEEDGNLDKEPGFADELRAILDGSAFHILHSPQNVYFKHRLNK